MMTPEQVRKVLAYASATDPRVRRNDPDERQLQVASWHAQIGRYEPVEAREAIDQHYASAEPAALLPGRLRSLIAAARAARLAADPEALPDADPDDPTAYRAALRDGRVRVASGSERPRPVQALLERGFRSAS